MTYEADIAAILSVRLEEHCLGVLCGGSASTAARIDTCFTVDDLKDAMARLGRLPKPCIGVVCRPELVRELRALDRGYPPSALCPQLYGLPVYEKMDQPEPYRLFYDHDELQRYLEA